MYINKINEIFKKYVNKCVNKWIFPINNKIIYNVCFYIIFILYKIILILLHIIFLGVTYLFNDFLNLKIIIKNTNYIMNDLILLFIFLLYLFYFIIISIEIVKKLKNYIKKLFLINKRYLYSFALFLLYSIYNKVNLVYLAFYFFYILLLLILLYSLKNYKIIEKIKNERIKKILISLYTKNYIFYIHKILLIQFFYFLIYIYSDMIYCESFLTKLLHDTFMEVGSSIGIKKETNVSILETIGMFTILGTISFGTIKAYLYVQGTEHRSIENKLENLEERLEILNQKVDLNRNLIENNITLTSEEATIIKLVFLLHQYM